MNHPQPTQVSQAGSQVYAVPPVQALRKKVYDNPADDPEYEPERHCFGYTCAVIIIFYYIFKIGFNIKFTYTVFSNRVTVVATPASEVAALFCVSWLFNAYFYVMILYDPKYCGGKPDSKKMWPNVVSFAFCVLAGVTKYFKSEEMQVTLEDIFFNFVVGAIAFAIYFQEDGPNGCCLCLKPWGFVKKQTENENVYPGQLYGQDPYQSNEKNYGKQNVPYAAGQAYGQAPIQYPGQIIPPVQPANSENNHPTRGPPQGNPPKYFKR